MSKEPYDPMDLKALRCFEAMAKHGSLTLTLSRPIGLTCRIPIM